MELKSGYKQTEVGVIPEDWEVRPLADICRFENGDRGSNYPSPGSFVDSGVPFINAGHVSDGVVHVDKLDYITQESYQRLGGGKVVAGDILFCLRGSLGKFGVIPGGFGDGAIASSLIIIRPKPKSATREFISSYLASDVCRKMIDLWAGGAAQPNLGGSDLAKFSVALPPTTAEQSAIATALSDVDALLSAQDALIAKKRAIKQGAMQELLTGKRRLPGFSGEWEVKRLRDVAAFYKGKGLPKSALSEFGTDLCIHYGELFTRYPETISKIFSRTDQVAGAFRSAANDVLMPTSDVTPRGLAKASCVRVDDVILGGDILVIRSDAKRINGSFLSFLIRYEETQVLQFVTGSTVFHLYGSDMKKFTFAMPPHSEQIAIVEVLSDMDANLAALQARRDKTILLKQGMMQELLTGRTRLAEPATNKWAATDNVVEFTAPRKKTQGKAVKVENETGDKKTNVHFKRSVLAAEIVEQLHNEPTFGHVKFEKLIFLTEHLCKVDTGSNYHRDAAGPYDNRALRSIDSQLKTQKWFEAQKLGGRYQYVPLEKHGGHKEYFDRYYASIRPRLDEIIATFRTAKTEQCEIIATLYSAWNDLLKQGKPATDDAIVDQVLNHWHEDKKRIEPGRWHKALDWMRKKAFVPEGSGLTC